MIALILLSHAAQAFPQLSPETGCSSSENCVLIGAVCTEISTCAGGSICVDNICSCVDGHREQNGICTPLDTHGGQNVTPAITRNQVKQLPFKNLARPSIGLAGMPCGMGNVCRPMSMCREEICQCRNGYVASFGECIRNPSVRRIYVKPLPVNGG